ncbi:MAG: asparaginase [Alicyclobacillus sp.]|nr:asparaginase [Alicyclobacillus sp.]
MTGYSHVRIITTGGTIASLPQDNGDLAASLSGEELVQRLGMASVQVDTLTTMGSFAFNYETLAFIGERVIEALESPDVQGVVLTHGTDTMEETAFYLSLTTGHYMKPVVLTGAQLDASNPYGDGPNNLRNAVCIAQSESARNIGTVIAFAGFLYAAREVRKVDTNALEAFDSPGWGPVGRMDGDRVIVLRQADRKPVLNVKVPVPVALVRLGVGMTGAEFQQMCTGYKGVVLEAFGRGNAHPSIHSEISRLVQQGVPVIITSRCIRGAVRPVYGGGGGRDLERAGAWFAGDLAGEKARILLGLLLANNVGWQEMWRFVEAYSRP